MIHIQSQLAFFLKDNYNEEFENISLKIKKHFTGSINTSQLPIGESAPPEMPRITVNYEGYDINASKNRMDLIINNPKIHDSMIENFNTFPFSDLGMEIVRIGLVKMYFEENKSVSALKDMLNAHLKNKLFKEVNIRFNLPFNFDGMECNDIEKLDIGKAIKKTESGSIAQDGLIIVKDVNSSETNKNSFSEDKRHILIDQFNLKASEFYAIGVK